MGAFVFGVVFLVHLRWEKNDWWMIKINYLDKKKYEQEHQWHQKQRHASANPSSRHIEFLVLYL